MLEFSVPFHLATSGFGGLLRPILPEIAAPEPFSSDRYIEFEWIGDRNYLNERVRGQTRTRGANCTSADAAVISRQNDGTKTLILIEWKYTEEYGDRSLRFSKNGTDRLCIYKPLLQAVGSPIDIALLAGNFDSILFDPFDQLMRLQLLAHEIEKEHWAGISKCIVLHIASSRNRDIQRVTSSELRGLGKTAIEVWTRLVRPADRFISVSTEDLFEHFPVGGFPDLAPWHVYEKQRYDL